MGNQSSAPAAPTNAAGAIGYTKCNTAPNVVRRTPASELKIFLAGPGGAGKTQLSCNLKFPVDEQIRVISAMGITLDMCTPDASMHDISSFTGNIGIVA